MRYIYYFSKGAADGDASMKEILGGKGANLAEMARLGLPIPPGFTISAEICRHFHRHQSYPEGLREEVEGALRRLEEETGKRFGDRENPLLVSVRSGAAVSMPGMMDTVLNVGLNEETLEALIRRSGNPRFGWDAYRRLIQMFGNVVKGIPHERFDDALGEVKRKRGVKLDTELGAEDLKEVTERFQAIYRDALGEAFPQDPRAQLWAAIDAVFQSWDNPRAVKYREIHGLPHDALGTAVNVQTMVFGNLGEASATGVAFTRDVATGERRHYGEYLTNAQGEDVVAGIRTPQELSQLGRTMPDVYRQLTEIFETLERHYRDVQDVEFTVEEGKLYMLQTRRGQRTPRAAVRIAVDMAEEGLISREEALQRVSPTQIEQLLHPSFDPTRRVEPIAVGLAASPGAAVGRAVFTAQDAEEWAARGERVILVRRETSPDDVGGMKAAQGILTSRGGFTSHAAIVGRGMGVPAVVGCEALQIDAERKRLRVREAVVGEGDWLSIDGTTGEVMLGQVPLVESGFDEHFQTLMGWADEVRTLGVRANADTPEDARRACELGAEGIGLARTEHMFFGEERLRLFQRVILTEEASERRALLNELGRFQQSDFEGLLEAMDGLPVIIRLLDPPLHEFLPQEEGELTALAREAGVDPQEVCARVEALREFNPMLGHRGCRLGITSPEIYEMQVEAIARAAARLKRAGKDPKPRIMIPLVGHPREMEVLRRLAEEVLRRVAGELDVAVDYKIGTMIEVPRACVAAEEIARHAEFFSFGTNDLTQMTFGFSRDDAGKFLPAYDERGILSKDPFLTIDQEGVGALMELAVRKGRMVRPDISIGICGEHGGEEESVKFCHRIGLDYVSASPYRVPVARLAAAQAALFDGTERATKSQS